MKEARLFFTTLFFPHRAALLAALLAGLGALAAPARAADMHYAVVRQSDDGRLVIACHERVQAETRGPTGVVEGLAEIAPGILALADTPTLDVTVAAPDGRVRYEERLSASGVIRAELPATAAAGTPGVLLPGRFFRLASVSFAVRTPPVAGGVLRLRSSAGGQPVEVALHELERRSPPLPRCSVPGSRVRAARRAGSPANRLDILYMGDGYRAEEAAKFAADASALESDFFSVSPYGEYRSYVNSYQLFTASPESGADHPPYQAGCSQLDLGCCADTDALSDPLAGTYVNSLFSARFCTYGIHRLLTANTSAVLAAAAAMADWDMVMLVVNDATYGGSGGTVPVTSTDPSAVTIMQHEFGHSFTGLADEYESPYPGFPACSDVSGPACEPNVTDQTTRELVKWNGWISPDTPLPTPETSQYEDLIGLFEGARYVSSGKYRPKQWCAMRANGVPFCAVCAQEFVLRLYGGGWGIPAAGVELIEPGSASPEEEVVEATHPAMIDFSVSVLQPTAGPAPTIRWYVDDAEVVGQQSATFAYQTTGPGTIQVQARVADPTPLVLASFASELESAHAWTLTVTAGTPVPVLPAAGAGLLALLAAALVRSQPAPRRQREVGKQ
ncbi:MAG: hypothetical protein HYV63_11545 [Candidatus Schekmanbacteria bacterium]|nr:hypothetical protein [Candidatus Schekmanbacteria bacterium]